jgi:hypothetical protein
MQHSSSARSSDMSLAGSGTDCDGAKFDGAHTAETFFTGPGELLVSLRTAEGSSREPQMRIAAAPAGGALSLAAKELWQSSLCVDDRLTHAREPHSAVQSDATSIARRVKIAIGRCSKKPYGRLFMLITTLRRAKHGVNSTARRDFVPRLSSRMRLPLGSDDFAREEAVDEGEVCSGEQNADRPPYRANLQAVIRGFGVRHCQGINRIARRQYQRI